MPIQAKNGLAAILAADDMKTSRTGGKVQDKDDADSGEFGAALGGLIAAMVSPVASSNSADSKVPASGASDTTVPAIVKPQPHTSTAASVPSPSFRQLGGPTLTALFDSPATDKPVPADKTDQSKNVVTSSGSRDIPTTKNSPATSTRNIADTVTAPPTAAAAAPTVLPTIPPQSKAINSNTNANTPTPIPTPAPGDSVPAAAISATFAGVSIKIEKIPAATHAERKEMDTQPRAPISDHPAAPAKIAEPAEIRSAATPAATSKGEEQNQAELNVTKATTENRAAAKTSADPVARPTASQKTADAPVAPAPIAARAANAYRQVSETVAPAREHSAPRHDSAVAADSDRTVQSTSDAPAAKVTEAAPIREITDSISAAPETRVANLKLDLGDGSATQATVREHAGTVDVKIVAPGADSARRISGEVDGLRNALEGAGLALGHSEVSYQSGSGQGGREQRGEPYRNSNQQPGDSKQIFTLNEVSE